MNDRQDISISTQQLSSNGINGRNLQLSKCHEVKYESGLIELANDDTSRSESKFWLNRSCGNEDVPQTINAEDPPIAAGLFRLFVKNGEYVYARPNDIIMMESCNHLVKVYLGINDKVKLTIRLNTLKDFLLQLPGSQFVRFGRFCAVNIQRLSGGNYNQQMFEFDFKFSIKLKHSVSHAVFTAIGK